MESRTAWKFRIEGRGFAGGFDMHYRYVLMGTKGAWTFIWAFDMYYRYMLIENLMLHLQ